MKKSQHVRLGVVIERRPVLFRSLSLLLEYVSDVHTVWRQEAVVVHHLLIDIREFLARFFQRMNQTLALSLGLQALRQQGVRCVRLYREAGLI